MSDVSATEPRKRGGLFKVFVILSILVVIGGAAAGGFIWYFSARIIGNWEEMGFTKAPMSDSVLLDGSHDQKLWYWVNSIEITGTVANDIALYVNTAEITGHIQGDLYFFGNRLTIQPGARVDGKIVLEAANEVVVPQALRTKCNGTAAKFSTIPNAPGASPPAETPADPLPADGSSKPEEG